MNEQQLTGIGMTSQRTRDRMLVRLREQGVLDELVLSAIAAIPRHIFVDEALSIRAYEDVSLPIGYGQTISQPYTVAFQSQLLEIKKGDKVKFMATGKEYFADEVGVLGLEMEPRSEVKAGDVGYIISGIKEAREVGVQGVPFFVLNRKYGISGAQPEDYFSQALNQLWEEENPLKPISKMTKGQTCDDEGCSI